MSMTVTDTKAVITASTRVRAYWQLLKPRLSMLVAFSSVFGYVLGNSGSLNSGIIAALFFGGFLVSGSAVIINQILEKDLDALMNRRSSDLRFP